MPPSLLAPKTETQVNTSMTSTQYSVQITALSDCGWVINVVFPNRYAR
jgi:hypothetical protein